MSKARGLLFRISVHSFATIKARMAATKAGWIFVVFRKILISSMPVDADKIHVYIANIKDKATILLKKIAAIFEGTLFAVRLRRNDKKSGSSSPDRLTAASITLSDASTNPETDGKGKTEKEMALPPNANSVIIWLISWMKK